MLAWSVTVLFLYYANNTSYYSEKIAVFSGFLGL